MSMHAAMIVLAALQLGQINFQAGGADNVWTEKLAIAVNQQLEETLLRRENRWYARFSVSDVKRPAEPGFGFADRPEPRGEKLIKSGLIEFANLTPKAYALPGDGRADWKGEAYVRIMQYRLFDPAAGWSEPKLVAIH